MRRAMPENARTDKSLYRTASRGDAEGEEKKIFWI